MSLKLHYVLQNIKEHFSWRLIRINPMNQFLSVVIEDWLAFPLVSCLAVANHVNVGVIEAILLQRPALQPLNQLIYLGAAKVKNRHDIKRFPEDFSLVRIAGNAIQHKRICLGMESPRSRAVVDEIPPKLDRRFVRNQLALARVLQECLADGTIGFQAPKNVAARAMKEIWDGAEDFALGSFAGAGSAEQKDRAKFHGASLCFSWISFIS
jgi:hypothetical protein